jgi:hypothetical protein
MNQINHSSDEIMRKIWCGSLHQVSAICAIKLRMTESMTEGPQNVTDKPALTVFATG